MAERWGAGFPQTLNALPPLPLVSPSCSLCCPLTFSLSQLWHHSSLGHRAHSCPSHSLRLCYYQSKLGPQHACSMSQAGCSKGKRQRQGREEAREGDREGDRWDEGLSCGGGGRGYRGKWWWDEQRQCRVKPKLQIQPQPQLRLKSQQPSPPCHLILDSKARSLFSHVK